MEYTHHVQTPLGGVTMASNGRALTGLWFDGQKHFAETLSALHAEASLTVFEETEHWLNVYFSGRIPDFTPSLDPKGSPFRKSVWKALITVPCGCVITYGRLAEQAGRGLSSARAVGGAVGHNPISLIIPCHRVVGADGGLTGYAGGTERKQFLLRLEQKMTVSLPGRHGEGEYVHDFI